METIHLHKYRLSRKTQHPGRNQTKIPVTKNKPPDPFHTNSVQIPVELGERKVRAEKVLNNIEVANKGTYYQVTSDVNNAGLVNAKFILVTTAKATPTAPMETYLVGSLEQDGIAEFDVTFTNPESNVIDLVVTYKDVDGNQYQTTVQATLGVAVVSGKSTLMNMIGCIDVPAPAIFRNW